MNDINKQNFLNVLNHKSGKIPFDVGGLPVTVIHCSTLEKLREYYGLEKRPIKIADPFQMLGVVDDDLREKINIGTIPVWNEYNAFGFKNEGWKHWTAPWGQTVFVPEKFNTTEDDCNVYIYAQGDCNYRPSAIMPKSGYFFDVTDRQTEEIDDDLLDPKDNMEEFTLWEQGTIEKIKEGFEKYKNADYVITCSPGGMGIGDIALIPGLNLKQTKGIRTVEEWYVSTLTRRDYLHQVFQHQTEIAITNLEAIKCFSADVECVVSICGTDFGTQTSTFCSLATFEELYAPYYKAINGWIHKNTKWKTFKHSCGAVESFFPSFIYAGFDIINPVQWTAKGMDKKRLKDTYGKELVFWGGGVKPRGHSRLAHQNRFAKKSMKPVKCFQRMVALYSIPFTIFRPMCQLKIWQR